MKPRKEPPNEAIDAALSDQRSTTRIVILLRLAVLVLLVSTAIVVSLGAYKRSVDEERENFAQHFEDSAHKVIESLHRVVTQSLTVADILSSQIT